MDYHNAPDSYTKKYLPSKKILIILGIILIAFILYLVIPKIIIYSKSQQLKNSLSGKFPEPLISTDATPTNFGDDTDGDGILDWQEILFGLDYTKSDTDGDGVPDTLPTIDGKSIADVIQLPSIDKLVFNVYSNIEKNGNINTVSKEVLGKATIEEISKYMTTIESQFKKYTLIDFTITGSEPQKTVTYRNSIIALANKVQDPGIFIKNVQEKILTGNQEATNESVLLKNTLTQLLSMPVPMVFADLHLALLNQTYTLVQIVESPYNTDELVSYTLSVIAQKNMQKIQETVDNIIVLQSLYVNPSF